MKNLFYLLIIILGIISYQQVIAPNNNSAVKEKTAEQNITKIQEYSRVKKNSSIQEKAPVKNSSDDTRSNSKRVSDNNDNRSAIKIEEPKKEEPIVLSYRAERYLDEIMDAYFDKNIDKASEINEKLYNAEGVLITYFSVRKVSEPCPVKPHPENPKITVNGETYSGKICVKLDYKYKGKQFEAGKCRNWVKNVWYE